MLRVSAAEADELHGLLAAAERPLVVAGGSLWSQSAADGLQMFAEASAVPVACSFRRQDHLDNESTAYVGDLGLGIAPHLPKALAESDLVVLLGGRFGEAPSGAYRSLTVPRPAGGRLVHVHASADELNRVYEADLAIAAAAPSVVESLMARGPLPSSAGRAAYARDLRASYEAWRRPHRATSRRRPGAGRHLRTGLPPDAIVTNGAGNYTVWVHRYHRHRRYGVQLAPTSGAMGYGLRRRSRRGPSTPTGR